MRVRLLHLRGLAALLALGWAGTAVAVIASYHPGGPLDLVAATAPIVATAAAGSAVLWPPLARADRAAAAMSWLGIAALLLLVPGLIDLVGATGHEASLLFPSPESAYAWVLALLATSAFAGLGVARRLLGATALRAPRLALGILIAVAIGAVGGGISAAAILANDLALRTALPAESDWGPTGGDVTPPDCGALVIAGEGARVTVDASATVDGRSAGTVALAGIRTGRDESWHADVTGAAIAGMDEHAPRSMQAVALPPAPASTAPSTGAAAHPGSGATAGPSPAGSLDVEYVRVGDRAWQRVGGAGAAWRTPAASPAAASPPPTLDDAVVQAVLPDRSRVAAEDAGIDVFDGARARHCRLTVDGPTALAAFPVLRLFIGRNLLDTATALQDWRGTLDWWVFTDHELGVAEVTVGGFTLDEPPGGVQAILAARLTARDRGARELIGPPAP